MDLPAYVYIIRCSTSGRVYVGRTRDPEQRWLNHLYALKAGRHNILLMQIDFDTYGENDFSFTQVAKINSFEERAIEKDLMLSMETYNPNKGYNYSDMYFEHNLSHQERMESIEKKYGIDKKLLFRDAS